MAEHGYRAALIVGVGSGVSASLARLFNKAGIKVALAARRAANLADLANETGALALACDATDRSQVSSLFAELDKSFGAPDVVVYNAGYRTRGPFVGLEPPKSKNPLQSPLMVDFWSLRRRSSACCRAAMARSCLPAPRRA